MSTGLQRLLDVEARRHVEASQIKVTWFSGPWHSEIFARSRQAIQHICTLVEEARMKARVEDFLLRPRQRQHLAVDNPLKRLLDAWVSGTRDVEQLVAIADQGLNGRYIVAAPGQPNGDLRIMVAGRDFNLLGQDWLSRVPSLCIEDWPDVAYGRWVAQSYREAWRRHEPRLDDLDCFIDWPGIGRRRYGYGRLILPCLSTSGSRVLLGAMLYDSNVDLRAGSRILVANEQRGSSDAGIEHRSRQRQRVPSQDPRKSDRIDVHIGVRLRQRRVLLGITQEALAQRIGISFQQMQKYETGENRISAARLFRLSQLLDVPITWFFGAMKPESTGT